MTVSAIVVSVVALAGLAFVAREHYGVAPRVLFAFAFAFGVVGATVPGALAALVAAGMLIVLGAITTSVDRVHIRIERAGTPPNRDADGSGSQR